MIYTKNDLKNFPSTTGIYKISFKNNNNDKVYIGSASGINNKSKLDNGFYNRWRKHIYQLSKNKLKTALQYATNKYGLDNILFEIIEECDSSICLEREQYYIDKYDSYNNGYNSRPKASNNNGIVWSDDQKKKIETTSREKRDDKYKEIEKLYNEGKSTREIANELHISRNTIRKIFNENNFIARKDKGVKKKPIFRYKMSGELVDKFNSITECYKKLNINKQGIKSVLNGKCKHYNNFYYDYELLSENEILEKINYLTKKLANRKYLNIKQVDENFNEIKIWKNIKEITNFYTDMKDYSIRRSIIKNIKYKEYYWKI